MPSKLRFLFLLLGICSLAMPPTDGRAEYIVRSGDILELKVMGSTSMQHRLPVDVDGAARIPLIGSVNVDGMGLDEINKIIKEQLLRKSLSRVSATGKIFREHFTPEQVSVHVAEYRPVYVAGDVARPGKQAFRPGLTVGQAVALAGGYNRLLAQAVEVQMKSFDWQSELSTLLITLVQQDFQLRRIKSELANDKGSPDFSTFRTTVSPKVVAELARIESKRFLLNRSKFDKERKYLRAAISTRNAQLGLLHEQQAKDKRGRDADTQEHQRLHNMAKKGITTSARVTDARRNTLFSSTRYLETTSRISAVAREQDDLHRRLEKLEEERRGALLKELTMLVAAQSSTNQKMKFLLQKLAFAPGGKRNFRNGAIQVEISIARKRGGSIVEEPHSADDLLEPGDLLTVVMNKDATVHDFHN